MTPVFRRVAALFVAVTVLLAGHGLQLSLLPTRAEALGWSTPAIAATGSAYFLGFVAGCLTIPSIVSRVAHIRTFMVMAALATAALLAAGLADHQPTWLLLRFATGFALSGLYMVIESWLADVAPATHRGALLGTYAMVSLLAMAAGQAFLGSAPPESAGLVILAAMLLCLASVPIGLTRLAQPPVLPRTRFSPRILLQASRVAVLAAFFGGMVTGAIWAVGPLVGRSFGLTASEIGIMMGMAIGGGALVQLPAGRLSDRFDRRRIIAGLLVLGGLVAAAAALLAPTSSAALYAAMFAIGATAMPLYALCIATASDASDAPLIQIASGILIMNSLGSIAGPMLVAPLLEWFGGAGFFVYVTACLGAGATVTLYRLSVAERHAAHPTPFVILPKTTPVVAQLTDAAAADPTATAQSPPGAGHAD